MVFTPQARCSRKMLVSRRAQFNRVSRTPYRNEESDNTTAERSRVGAEREDRPPRPTCSTNLAEGPESPCVRSVKMESALITKQRLDAEAVHFCDSATKDMLHSKGNGFYIR